MPYAVLSMFRSKIHAPFHTAVHDVKFAAYGNFMELVPYDYDERQILQ